MPNMQKYAIAGLVLRVLAFSLLSTFPLKNFLFAHPETGEYGILSDHDHNHDQVMILIATLFDTSLWDQSLLGIQLTLKKINRFMY